MQIGCIVKLKGLAERMEEVRSYGFRSVQLNVLKDKYFTDENAELVRRVSEKTGITISSLWCGWPGPGEWNFTEGPATLGLVPEAYRYERTQVLIRGAEFAHQCGIRNLVTHAGFLPEDCNDPLYKETLIALSQVVEACRRMDMNFLFETGQETPVTLLRTIEDLGERNVGVNLDCGNLILYGKGNPNDAVTVLGKHLMEIHCKDGVYPTDGKKLGRKVPLGTGMTDWPRLIRQLYAIGYDGPLTIEYECPEPQQTREILAAQKILSGLLISEKPKG